MNKSELAERVAGKLELPVSTTKNIIDEALNEIIDQVGLGKDVTLHGFGTFRSKDRAPRTSMNPQTGEKIEVPAKKAVSFKPSKTFKDEINN